jgi:hypothetical protein
MEIIVLVSTKNGQIKISFHFCGATSYSNTNTKAVRHAAVGMHYNYDKI